MAKWWMGQVAGALAGEGGLWQVFDGRAAAIDVVVPVVPDHTPKAYHGKTDLFVCVGAAAAGAESASEVMTCRVVAELKRPFDLLTGKGSSCKDQLLLEVAGYAKALANARGDARSSEAEAWRPMCGLVTDLFRLNVGLTLPAWQVSSEEGPWELGLSTRAMEADVFVKWCLGLVVLGCWDEVDASVRAAVETGGADPGAWVDRLLEGAEEVVAVVDPDSNEPVDPEPETGEIRRTLRSRGGASSHASRMDAGASSSSQAAQGSSGGSSGSGGAGKKALGSFVRVAATRKALDELVDNVGQDGGRWW